MSFLFHFCIGVGVGIVFESSYRSWNAGRIVPPRVINVIMYGFTGLFLGFLKQLDLPVVAAILLVAAFTTGIEFTTYVLYRRVTRQKLWDYSDEKWNYKGIVCLRFSSYWLIMSLLYYYWVV